MPIDPRTMRAIRQIESGGNPNATTGSYKGLYQLSDGEFRRYGGQGSIYDPAENERVAGNPGILNTFLKVLREQVDALGRQLI